MRHAKSSWADPGARDFDRPLNPRGRVAAVRMGQWLGEQKIGFDHVLASPAVRVAETLERVAEGYGRRWKIAIDRSIYEASPEVLVDLVRRFPDSAESALIVGHSPGLQLLALALARADRRVERDQVALNFPTAAVVQLQIAVDRWSEVAAGEGDILAFITPRMLPEL